MAPDFRTLATHPLRLQTEYKLHLLSPAPHRFEKLKTQLKWRLIEGGSVALYELGVVDDGTLVGLSKGDMDASLDTLGRMLAGLGGGQVRVRKVFRLAGDGSRDRGLAAAGHRMEELAEGEAAELFVSFWVEGRDEVVQPMSGEAGSEDEGLFAGGVDIDLDLSLDPPPIPVGTAAKSVKISAPVHHSPAFCGRRYKKPHDPHAHHDKVQTQWPQRTPEERAVLKREKRDKGRRKSDGHLALSSSSAPTSTPTNPAPRATPAHAHASAPKAIPQANQRRPSVKLSRSEPKPAGAVSKLRPSLLREGEERWVVEVEVRKRAGGKRAEEVGGGEESEADGDGGGGGEEDGDQGGEEPEHGWAYLDFDFLGPNGAAVAR